MSSKLEKSPRTSKAPHPTQVRLGKKNERAKAEVSKEVKLEKSPIIRRAGQRTQVKAGSNTAERVPLKERVAKTPRERREGQSTQVRFAWRVLSCWEEKVSSAGKDPRSSREGQFMHVISRVEGGAAVRWGNDPREERVGQFWHRMIRFSVSSVAVSLSLPWISSQH